MGHFTFLSVLPGAKKNQRRSFTKQQQYGVFYIAGTYVSNSSSISIRFISDSSIQRGGFSLLLTSFHLGPCSASEFSCDTDRYV